ncbi:MAG: cytochrome b5 domain-containing protein [Candidatus Paceibacterota bacterium]|jgi:cytochrome b involved in lipid metabolism
MNKITSTIVFLGVAGLIIIGIVFVRSQVTIQISVGKPVPQSATSSLVGGQKVPAAPAQASVPTTQGEKSYTLVEVTRHDNAQDCWSVVRGGVYNLTEWINQHPGGSEAIISMCGNDSTASFVDQHGGRRSPESELASLKIGILK